MFEGSGLGDWDEFAVAGGFDFADFDCGGWHSAYLWVNVLFMFVVGVVR